MCSQPASASMAKYTGWGKRIPTCPCSGDDPSPTEEVHGLCLLLSPPPPGISSDLLLWFLPDGGYRCGDSRWLDLENDTKEQRKAAWPLLPPPLIMFWSITRWHSAIWLLGRLELAAMGMLSPLIHCSPASLKSEPAHCPTASRGWGCGQYLWSLLTCLLRRSIAHLPIYRVRRAGRLASQVWYLTSPKYQNYLEGFLKPCPERFPSVLRSSAHLA